MSNMCDLPEDVVTEVLARVPMDMAPRLRTSQLYMTRCTNGPKKMTPDVKIEMEHEDKTSKDVIEYKNDSKVVVGSCNGVVCVRFKKSRVAVLNPCTKQCLELHQVQPKCGYWKSIGFGYDHVHDDYKVVRLARDDVNLSEVKVYSFRLNCWKDVDVEHPNGKHKAVESSRGIFVNGALHWIIFDGNLKNHAILAYDLATEKLCVLPLPAEASDELFRHEYGYYFGDTLGDVDGCLRFFLIKNDKCDMWMMKEYDVHDSWTKLSLQTPNHFSTWKNWKREPSWQRSLLRCNFDARRILKPMKIIDDYLIYRTHNNENEVEDLIQWRVPCKWTAVFTFTPSLVKLPTHKTNGSVLVTRYL